MPITTTPDVGVPPRVFLPEGFDPADTFALGELGAALLDRPLLSAEELENWLIDWGELQRAVIAGRSRRRIEMTRNTLDESLREAFFSYDRDVIEMWRRIDDRLNRRLLACEWRTGLPDRFTVYLRNKAMDASLFSEANLSLLTREEEVAGEYETRMGNRMVSLGGETLTPPQAATHLRDADRATREAAWRAMAESRLALQAQNERTFDDLLVLRDEIAANAGCEGADRFRTYCFRKAKRFDYGPGECEQFHDAVEAVIVPALRELREHRRASLGVESLRPWDTEVDLESGGRMQPFEREEELRSLVARLFGEIDGSLAADFDILVRNDLLDLMSRHGKAPGGYNAGIADIRLPFIFMNAAGRHADVMTLLHEGGHAFHTIACRDIAVPEMAHAPMEFCEVASMAMEFFGLERIARVYEPGPARRAILSTLERRLGIFAWIATIDAFQQWIYTHPGHSRSEREEAWLRTHRRFSAGIDWEGLEAQRSHAWHGQRHVFMRPFYYIEYGIALLGALQLWRAFRRDAPGTVESYRGALALGATRTLPELFEAAGARFAMDEEILRSVTDDMMTGIREAR